MESNSRIGAFSVFLFVIAVAFLAIAAYPATTFSPLKKPVLGAQSTQQISTYQLLLPEGFAFFTRDPREPDIKRYRRHEGSWRQAGLGPHSLPSNLLGLDRWSRTQGVEYAMLLQEYELEEWTDCDGDPIACLDSIAVADTIQNADPQPTLCGVIGFVRQEPVPWAWSSNRESLSMPAHILKLNVICSN